MANTDGLPERLPDGLTARALRAGDIPAACALNAEAGWNQVAADWAFMVEVGAGLVVEDTTGRIGASAMLLPYGGRYGWIAMILVSGDWQRRGIASLLMRRCIAECRARGLIAGLDATEQGRPVYLPLGFRDIYEMSRMAGHGSGCPGALPVGLRAMRASDLEAVIDYDAVASGAERAALLRHLHARQPDLALVAERLGAVSGYLLARDGRIATQLGPLLADDGDVACALLRAAIDRTAGPVFLDVAARHNGLLDELAGRGFQRQRGYMRMLLGRAEPLDDPVRVCVIAGPEFG